jgi:hypothetical protein
MEVKYLKVYQSVYFKKALESHFPNRSSGEVKMQVLEGVGALVSNESDSIIIPYSNIVFLQVEPEKKSAKK